MVAPTSYTESSLAAYMHAVLGDTAGVLGWAQPANYLDVVDNTLLAYGVSDIAEATDIAKLRALARREVWRAVVAALVPHVDFETDGQRVSESQMRRAAESALAVAEADCAALNIGAYAVQVGTFRFTNDPYDRQAAEWSTT